MGFFSALGGALKAPLKLGGAIAHTLPGGNTLGKAVGAVPGVGAVTGAVNKLPGVSNLGLPGMTPGGATGGISAGLPMAQPAPITDGGDLTKTPTTDGLVQQAGMMGNVPIVGNKGLARLNLPQDPAGLKALIDSKMQRAMTKKGWKNQAVSKAASLTGSR